MMNAGDRLGPYEILAMIGKGGMGEVYRAHDPRLRRDVAIKVSNAQFTERFTREARTIAQLNHTNIAHLYDVGPNYLVMEYVEGEDLKGPLSFDDALPLVAQLIDGIEAAHEKNIIHRDLKPANIKVTPEGVVKILDFGLAKAMEPPRDADPDNSPTLTMGATQAGTILGTAAYMSPEQAKGKEADKRADIWSFAVVLFELLTGKRLFQGESAVEILGGVLNKEPDVSAAPARVHKLLAWCLEKDRKKRLAAIGDARRMLEQTEAAPANTPAAQTRLPWMIAAAGVLAAVAAIALWAPWRSEPLPDRPLIRVDMDLGGDVALTPADLSPRDVTISPDGTRLAYVSGTPRRLFVRRLDQATATELVGTQGADSPQFFPDGQWIVFRAGGKLNKISVDGGAVVPLGDVNNWAGSDWDQNGNMLVSQPFSKGMWRIPAAGGAPQTVLELAKGELGYILPQVLPGGKGILFSMTTGRAQEDRFQVLNPADGARKTIGQGGMGVRFIPASEGASAGHLIYNRESTLFAVPFDLEKLETRGAAVPILNDVAFYPLSGTGAFAVSDNGTLIYRRIHEAGLSRLEWIGPNSREPAGAKADRYAPGLWAPQLSPDGKFVGLGTGSRANAELVVHDLARDTATRIASVGGSLANAVWSPDGQHVVFASEGGIVQARPDGASPPRPFLDSKELLGPYSFSPDGKLLSIVQVVNRQIEIMPVEQLGGELKAGARQVLVAGPTVHTPVFSPDGKWLAYTSAESGSGEVYVRSASASQSGRWQVSNNGGSAPHWSDDGRALVYQSGDRLMTAGYSVQGDTFVPGTPRVWIDKLGTDQWDLAPDGKRVLAIVPVEAQQAPQADHEITILFNFFDELRRKAPLGK